jgi:hypothetical protein
MVCGRPDRHTLPMGHADLLGHDESFVVRVTDVKHTLSPDSWRATIVHVATGERRYVTGYPDLCAFIESVRRRRRTPE